jgi:hypothetical protein
LPTPYRFIQGFKIAEGTRGMQSKTRYRYV